MDDIQCTLLTIRYFTSTSQILKSEIIDLKQNKFCYRRKDQLHTTNAKVVEKTWSQNN